MTMRFLKSSLFLIFSVLAVATEPALAQDVLGGTGGSPFSVNCAADKVVIGIVGNAGAVIDTMQVLCGQANGNDNDQPIGHIGPSKGGGPSTAVCPPLTALIGITVNKKMWRRHYEVSQIKLTCGFPDEGAQSYPVFGHDDGKGSIPAGNRMCPPRQLVGSITGRAGDWVDAVGIKCVPVSVLADRGRK